MGSSSHFRAPHLSGILGGKKVHHTEKENVQPVSHEATNFKKALAFAAVTCIKFGSATR